MSIFFGICLIGAAMWMGFARKKKRFNRTNQYGVQEFKSYEHSVGSDLADKGVGFIAGIFALIGTALILFGVMTG